MDQPPLLTLRGIAKTYPGVRALKGVDFDLRAGEVHALLGENGAGKSTLIKIITGVVSPDEGGRVVFEGRQIDPINPRKMQDLGIAAVYQNPTLFNELSVAENLTLGEGGPIISWKQRRSRAQELLKRIDAHLDLDAPVGPLRMAEKQLIEIARALGRNAKLLILDEPTASLAQHDADQLLDRVEVLRREGVGILYISHRLDEVLRIADRVTVLRDGTYIGTHDRAEVDRTRLIQLMAGRDLADMFPKANTSAGETVLETVNLGCRALGLHDVSIQLRRGEILGLAGLVGSGRTELARVLFGITPADAGEIRRRGAKVTITAVDDAMGLGIAYVPEDRKEHGVIEDLSIFENISLPILRRFDSTWTNEEAEMRVSTDYFTRLSVKAPSVFTTARQLSGGNQQKVALARWLATKPEVLILDEPTQGIDIGAKAEIHRLIGELAQQGLAILLISSELPELLGMADRIAVMRQGRIVGTVDAKNASRESVLHLAMADAS